MVSGIAEFSSDNIADAYPNPVTDKLTIGFNTLKGSYRLSLFDATGKVLQSESLTAGTFSTCELSLGNYSAGMYFIRISGTTNNYNQTIRIIKSN